MTFVHAQDDLHYRLHGGAMQSYKNDQVTLSGRTVKLKTIAATFASYPNSIGTFQVAVGAQLANETRNVVKGAFTRVKKAESDLGSRRHSMVEELRLGGQKKSWLWQDKTDPVRAIRKALLKVVKAAYQRPVSAITLRCSQGRGQRPLQLSQCGPGGSANGRSPGGVLFDLLFGGEGREKDFTSTPRTPSQKDATKENKNCAGKRIRFFSRNKSHLQFSHRSQNHRHDD